jgi:hypothetical protein
MVRDSSCAGCSSCACRKAARRRRWNSTQRPRPDTNSDSCLRMPCQANCTGSRRSRYSSMYQAPSSISSVASRAPADGVRPPSATTSSSSDSWPDRSSANESSISKSASGRISSSASRRCLRRAKWSGSMAAERAAKAAVSAMLSARSEVSCLSCGTPPATMPWRSEASSGPSRRMTSARSSREVLALAIHTSSSAVSRTARVSSLCRPLRSAVVASTSAQTWNRKSRTPSCTGTPSSSLRSSIVYWMASVSRCSTWLASDTPFLVVSFWSRK